MNPLVAHPKTKEGLDAIAANPRACYMLVGARYSGKLASALYVAKTLHCGGQEGCTGCKRIMVGTDPDVRRVAPNEKGTITIEMAHDLVSSLSKHPNRKGATRVVIIEAAERLTIPAQNALLKVIEEPPANTVFLLLLRDINGVLSTIKSRCQVVYVRPVADLPELARGRAGLAMELADHPELNDIQKDIISQAQNILSAQPFEKMLLVDKLSKDSNQDEIIDALAYLVSKAARDKNTTSQALQSMQNYFIYSNAGVASKHALMEMMIRL